MEKPNPDPHPQPQPLKCPRCDSSNTKFCYFNNYSLSQPRHFCKACKRYWTRGGTLRSVPVGGGCRKNKRVKRSSPPQLASSAATSHVHALHDIDLSPPSNHMSSSLFYNNIQHPTNNNPLELNFPFLRFASSRVSPGFDFYQPYLNSFGLGFSNSEVLPSEVQEDPVNILGSGSSSRAGNGILNGREVKMEDGNRLDQYNQVHHDQQQLINSFSDANNSSLLWNTSNISSWFDPSNNYVGSSVPSLI